MILALKGPKNPLVVVRLADPASVKVTTKEKLFSFYEDKDRLGSFIGSLMQSDTRYVNL